MSQKKILVVDDDPDVRLGLQLRLNANHYDVIFACDGVASIAEARKHMPDLMILDLGPSGRRWLQRSGEIEDERKAVLDPGDRTVRAGPRGQ